MTKREFVSAINGSGIYFTIFLSLLITSIIIHNYLSAIEQETIFIISNPLSYPLFIATYISSFYLALTAAISISKEKENKTLEVLFYGPVDKYSFILSKYFIRNIDYFDSL